MVLDKISLLLIWNIGITILFQSCTNSSSKEVEDKVYLSGEFKGLPSQTLAIHSINEFGSIHELPIATLALDMNGHFSDTVYGIQKGEYRLVQNKWNQLPLYLDNDMRIGLKGHFEGDRIIFEISGPDTEVTDFLIEKERITLEFYKSQKLNEVQFLQRLDSLATDLLHKAALLTNVDKQTKEDFRLDISFIKTYMQHSYERIQKLFRKEDFIPVSDDFPIAQRPDLIDGFDYDNDEYFVKFQSYRNIVEIPFYESIKQSMLGDPEKVYPLTLLEVINNNVTHAFKKKYYIRKAATYFDVNEPELSKRLYNSIIQMSKDESFNREIENAYEKEMSLIETKSIEDELASQMQQEGKVPEPVLMLNIADSMAISQRQKDFFVQKAIKYLDPNNKELTTKIYDKAIQMAGDSSLKARFQEHYDKISRLTKGNISPKFVDLEEYRGGTASLSDFRGSYVFIDIWATWCQPCLKQLPHLKRLQDKYKKDNIVFIGLSYDQPKEYQKWKSMIAEKNMEGIHLITSDGRNNSFFKEYGITSIPRFILLDMEGRIINSKTPYPSDPALDNILAGLF